ncbi:M20/M25/M40 family metallo-hydrolase [Caulobacter sp. 17J65-9]|uniref:M20/M25/M40 family metallo-hydrolase n=1 Tax=Caulobacter sp. 17J65-9 TaxID=2709382 RepID=UPI0013CCDF50|nr:M20/M25/M40 family metallo-hydrolase [Caulobacter sp. 17J65-9]NEX94031.1 M20/M25/M40 family metallo-hydrolase [Caulobacter sp. 17J65-9]
MKSWTLIGVLVAGAALAWASLLTPPPQSAAAPATAFSAERAMRDVEAIARAPHPTGSAENARVRDYLAGRLSELGLQVQIQKADVFEAAGWGGRASGATVENVIGVLPGRDPSLPAVAVMSHYDSVPSSPGAADDAVGVAAALETARALVAQGPRERDVIVAITDGEEIGLLGARAFFGEHPLAERVGAVVNMDVRGSSGPAVMYETGRGNGGWIRLFGDATRRPLANSLTAWIYERMPNGTDFTIPKHRGIGGLNFAFLFSPTDYHAASATPAHLDRGSLQHLGDQVLAATHDLAAGRELPKAAPDAVYSDVMGVALVRYPAWAGWVVLGAAGLFAGVALAGAVRKGFVVWKDAARGAGLTVFVGASVALVLRVLHGGPDSVSGWAMEAQQPLVLAGCTLVGAGVVLAALAGVRRDAKRWIPAALAVLLGAAGAVRFGGVDPLSLGLAGVAAVTGLLVFGRSAGAWCLWTGLLGVGFALAIAAQILAPTAAFLFAWPLLAASLAAAGIMGLAGGDFTKPTALAISGMAGLVAFAWLARFAGPLFVAMGFGMAELLALFAVLSLAPLWPLAAVWTRAQRPLTLAAICAAVGVGLVVFAMVRDPASARTPRPTQAFYVADLSTGRFARASGMAELDAWTKAALNGDGGAPKRAPLEALQVKDAWLADARPVAIATRPDLTLGGEGTRRVLTVKPAGGRELRLSLKSSAAVKDVTVNGRPGGDVLAKPGEWSRLRWAGPGEGLQIAFTAATPGALEVRYAEVQDGWPVDATPLPKRPADVAATGLSDATVLTDERRFGW